MALDLANTMVDNVNPLECLGGKALRNGVEYSSDTRMVRALIDAQGKYKTVVKDINPPMFPWLVDYIQGLPFVRGIYDFCSTAYTLALFIGLLLIQWVITHNQGALGGTQDRFYQITDLLIYVLLFKSAWDIGVYLLFVKRICEFHGAEHKTINAYLEQGQFTVEAIKQASRVSSRCGTNLVVFWLTILLGAIILEIMVGFTSAFLTAITMALSYALALEIFYIEDGPKRFGISLFYKLAALLQDKWFTREPTDQQIYIASLALKTLYELENQDLD